MKRNTKGFTLIELLAVIVILAIIALIATPIVLNIIERVRKGAAQDSAYGVRKSAQLYYQVALMDNFDSFDKTTITFTGNGEYTATVGSETLTKEQLNTAGFEIDNTIPSAGSITIASDGRLTFDGLTINNYTCDFTNGKFKCDKGSSNSGSNSDDTTTTD